jgi:catechol 2,3-dioxygenase-like lactoylglutathione lyase family enzyme
VVFEREDLQAAAAFLTAFGLVPVSETPGSLHFRGTGPSPSVYIVRRAPRARFVGFGLTVATRGEIETLARLPGACRPHAFEGPGGGLCVTLADPAGFTVEVVHGRAEVAPLPERAPLTSNSPRAHARIDATLRLPNTPPSVIKLGHVVLEVSELQKACAFYTQCFGFIPSDVQVLPDGSPGVVFLRLDLGDTPADHHTLALAQGIAPRLGHTAYELVDADAVAVGERVLRERGFEHAWGVGRHILGSQVFDYWYDPAGDKHEHYCDGDVFTASVPMGVHPLSREGMAQWGPPMPRSFTRPPLTPRTLGAVLRGLRTSSELDLRKLRALGKIFG